MILSPVSIKKSLTAGLGNGGLARDGVAGQSFLLQPLFVLRIDVLQQPKSRMGIRIQCKHLLNF
jgi:hypothetical protein